MRYDRAKAPLPLRHTSHSQLLFRVAQWDFAIPARLVTSIVPSPSILPFPNLPDWLAGILQAGSSATPVINLAVRLGVPSGSVPGPAVVIDPPGDLKKCAAVALLVDKILDTALVRPLDTQPVRGPNLQPFSEFLSGTWRGRSRPCYLLEMEKVIPPNFSTYLRTIFCSLR